MPESSTHNVFQGGMNKDVSAYLLKNDSWQHALNLVPDTSTGDLGNLSTESATQLCVDFPYTLIGAVPLDGDQWCVFLTDDTDSEIGIVDLSQCSYTKFSNTPCLNFNKQSLITGASRRNFDCGFSVYWSDGGRNPDRFINTNTTDVNNDIWVQNCVTPVGSTCTTCTNTDILDCDKIRIAPLMSVPCINLAKSTGAGTLLNGTYQVALAYSINGVKVTNYIMLSNVVSIFDHTNQAGALTCNITGADRNHFKEMIIVVISFVNSQLVAKRLGIYDTNQETIPIDNIDSSLVTVNTAEIPLQTPAIEKSDSVWSVNNYLLRNGIYEKPDFNYQPLANQITTNWVMVEYDEQYYHRSGDSNGMNVGYLRDEVYAFFIRWVYNTGDKSASYHIPGRAYNPATDASWATQNTGSVLGFPLGSLAVGNMAYWQSTERYPSQQASVWNSNVPGHPEWDLCGQPIRHHKFPDQTVSPILSHFNCVGSNNSIRPLGVQFSNIKPPVDLQGNPITNIVGYEILRGSREGNKSIIAKGMINNMRVSHSDVPNTTDVLYQNYPYNDLNPDLFLTTSQVIGTKGGNIDDYQGNTQDGYRRDIMSFHSPDTTFANPFLGRGILKTYQTLIGTSTGYFEIPYKHPKFKLITKLVSSISTAIIAIEALGSLATAAGGVNFKFAATEELPFDIPLGLAIASPDGPLGSIGTTVYALQTAYNIAVLAAIAPMKAAAIRQQMINAITGLIPPHQYARQYNSTGFYNDYIISNQQAGIGNYQYIKGYVQSFENQEVNNLFRNDYVILKLDSQLTAPLLPSGSFEVSRWTQGQRTTGSCEFCPIVGCPLLNGRGGIGTILPLGSPNLCSYYAAYKINFGSQYGQIGSIRQLPITSCVYPISTELTTTTPVLFGGDTYINRYTEKNPFLYFNDWLVNVPDDFRYDYTMFENVAYPRYWVNNTHVYYDFWGSADKNYHVDENNVAATDFWVKDGFFYLFNNGVRDFFVESDVNVGFRDWGEELTQHFYDPYGYTDIAYMFRSDMIKTDIYYKYDYSLSISKFYTQYLSFGQVLDRQYDPELAYTCYVYYPRRVAYSLPQLEELRADNWRQFLPNNYYDFYTQVTAIKSISNTGALFMLKEDSPVKFEGVQVLQQNDSSTAITIGDGGLFNQPLQSVINVDKGLGYGNCTARFGIVSTPHGIFYASQKEGRVFSYESQYKGAQGSAALEEISAYGLKYWFQVNLPSNLLSQFPSYPFADNPVVGVGVTMSYDEMYELLYISKKDFKVRNQYITSVEYIAGTGFVYNDPVLQVSRIISFSDITFFEDCSWTVSFACKEKRFISYHSWHPDFQITPRNHVMTSKGNSLYRHNNVTNLFAQYYSMPPSKVEIQYPINTQGVTTTLRNVEYYLSSYIYQPNGVDRNQLLDFNWDKAIIFSDDQISGYLNLFPKTNNPYQDLIYPITNSNSFSILYSNKEQHTRFNSFWDITKDRNTVTQMWQTQGNGVDKLINPLYVDYSKPLTQAKKFRNYNNSIFFQKLESNNVRMQIRLNFAKEQLSPR